MNIRCLEIFTCYRKLWATQNDNASENTVIKKEMLARHWWLMPITLTT
jgi:hypothetical protein